MFPVLSDNSKIVLLMKHIIVIRAMLAPNDIKAFVRSTLLFLIILAYLLRLMIEFQNEELPRSGLVTCGVIVSDQTVSMLEILFQFVFIGYYKCPENGIYHVCN